MHYIKHSDAELDAESKILLMNNHENHVISEFIALINDNHIRSLTLILHLTHCMQSLNVDICESYKNWHNKIIIKIVFESFIEYSLTHFLNDLIWIRNQTFKKDNIRFSFEKCEMWSFDAKKCIDLSKKFNFETDAKLKLFLLRMKQSSQFEHLAVMKNALKNHWELKIARNMQWSDLIQEDEFNSFLNKSKDVLFISIMRESELKMWQNRRQTELHDKKFVRKRLRAESDNLRLIKEDAKLILINKFAKEKTIDEKRANAQYMKIWRMKRDDIHIKGVVAREIEKARIKQLKELQKNINIISNEMFQSIVDLETEWKMTDSTWLAQQEAKKQEKKSRLEKSRWDDEEEDLEFIINQFKASWMNEDFVAFDDDSNDDAEHDARHDARYEMHTNHAKHDLDDEFLFDDFFDDWNDDNEVFSIISS